MTSEVTVTAEDLAAVGAVVRPDVGVCEKMRLEITPLVEGLTACLTVVGRLLKW